MILTALFRALPQIFHPAARRVLLQSLALTLLIFAGLGFGAWAGLRWFFNWIGWGDPTGGMAQAAAAALIAIIAGWVLFRTVAIAVLGLFADAIVEAVEQESYPDAAASAKPLSIAGGTRLALRSVRRNIGWNLIALPFYIALLVTGVGTVILLLLVNAYLLGRDLSEMVESRHPDLAPMSGGTRMAMGFVSALLFLAPVANLLAPIWSAAMAVHVLHRPQRNIHG